MLVPNGKRRLMVAQAAPDPTSEMAGGMDLSGVESGNTQFNDEAVQPQDGQVPQDPQAESAELAAEDPAGQLEGEVQQQETDQAQTGQEGDCSQTVFDFLVSLGYPPRRLKEFKSRFVSETGSANAGTTVNLVLPDEVYGQNQQIPREKIKELVQTIEQKHGLSFQDYKRANEELTLNFMTADAAQQASLENAGPGDILDKVYGKPSGGKGKGGKAARAQTIQEMIKESQDRQLNTLRLIYGSKK